MGTVRTLDKNSTTDQHHKKERITMKKTNFFHQNNTADQNNEKERITMKKNGKTNNFKKVLASTLAAIMILSTGSMLATTASAATLPAVTSQNAQALLNEDESLALANAAVNSPGSDAFFKGADALAGVVTTANPVAGIIMSGVLGAFQCVYKDSIEPEPTTADVINLINQLSAKIDDHFNEQTEQIKELTEIARLQNLANILTSIEGYNEKAMAQIALYKDDNPCAQDYQNIIDTTNGNVDTTTAFMDLSNLIINGQAGVKGLPTFKQYLELAKADKSNNNDAAQVRTDCTNFDNTVMEQYALLFTNLMTGLNAKYNKAQLQHDSGQIDDATLTSIQNSVKSEMELYCKKAAEVCTKYNEAKAELDSLTVAKVTIGDSTTEMFSLGDAWVTAEKNGGTIQLNTDWDSANLSKDVYYFTANDSFKDGGLYVNGQTGTLDLNGHAIVHSGSRKFDATVDAGTLNVIDSSGNKGSISGIQLNDGTINLNGITVRDASDSGVEANGGKLNADNCTFQNNSKTAAYVNNASADIKNCVFDGNSGKQGGAIRFLKNINLKERTLNVRSCDFLNNTADQGGAIYATYDAAIRDCNFRSNSSTGNGGAICFDYRGNGLPCVFSLRGLDFTDNKAGDKGGAIYCDSMNYLNLWDTSITRNEAKNAGGGLYAQKGSTSSCDPDIKGKITIIDNKLSNGTASNAFLGENTTSKCIFTISEKIDPSSRIGITSPTKDKTLDVVRTESKTAYENTKDVFSYDTNAYSIHRYSGFLSAYYWVEIVKN